MRKIGEISAVIALLSLSRLAITIPNLEPIGAAALFGGALLSSKYLRFLVPLLALFMGDLVIAIIRPEYAAHLFSPTFIAIYLAFAATVLIGKQVIGANPKMKNVLGGAVLSSVIFFIVTNFAVWADPMFAMYPKNAAGLWACYMAGLPFYKMTIVSNVVVSAVVFGVYVWYRKQVAVKQAIV
ncbi:MAG: hypothetical protein ACI9JN_000691 [Bacteroidia bacterium]|jgi:hypothetical protein